LKKKPIIFISQPKITPVAQPPAVKENEPIIAPAKESSRKNNKK
jgi:hypothetical protein